MPADGSSRRGRRKRWRRSSPRAGRGYRPGPYDGRVVLFRCAEDRALWRSAPDLGWDALVSGGVEIRDIPATHQFMMHEPAVGALAEQLESCLRRACSAAKDRNGPGTRVV